MIDKLYNSEGKQQILLWISKSLSRKNVGINIQHTDVGDVLWRRIPSPQILHRLALPQPIYTMPFISCLGAPVRNEVSATTWP
jgi:hypothetical protein